MAKAMCIGSVGDESKRLAQRSPVALHALPIADFVVRSAPGTGASIERVPSMSAAAAVAAARWGDASAEDMPRTVVSVARLNAAAATEVELCAYACKRWPVATVVAAAVAPARRAAPPACSAAGTTAAAVAETAFVAAFVAATVALATAAAKVMVAVEV
eukprot:2600181-Pleurochrysis_carterae.AAC.2